MKENQKREVRKGIGMVFQDGALFDSLTVGENVGYYLLEHTKLNWEEIEERVRRMLGFVGLDADEIIDKLPEELSGGMQRRVAIGRALLSTNPTVMLYDEPTTGLDPQSTETVLDLINKLTQHRRISTIVVTHEIADAIAVANRFMLIWEGELIFDGSTNDLRDSTDSRVRSFLEPFRTSFNEVLERKFV
jgi:phospholipid/cholesterol/gamma-HCH transport system ATP-binding protein